MCIGVRDPKQGVRQLGSTAPATDQDGRVFACALSIEVHIPSSGSLKSKRAVLRHLLDGARSRYRVAASEVGFQDQWQRSELAFAAVGGEPELVSEVLDKVERFVWSHPEITVVSSFRRWLDTSD